MINTKIVSAVLGREVTEDEMQYIYEDWRAFHDDPTHYAGTAVVQMVNQYLDELAQAVARTKVYCGAQSEMEDEIIEALKQGMMLESENGERYVTEENMAGGKYCCWANDEYGCAPVKLTNDILVAIAFVQ